MATDLVTDETTEVTVPDYAALLEAAASGDLAWLANRITDAPKGHTWLTRQEAIGAILDAHEQAREDSLPAGLLRRFFWGHGESDPFAGWRHNQPSAPSAARGEESAR